MSDKQLESVWWHVRLKCKRMLAEVKKRHARKLENLSVSQDKPLLNTKGYLTILDEIQVPMVVEEIFRLGPKHPILQKFKEEHFLASMDLFLEDCQRVGMPVEALNKINALTLHYSATCLEQKPNRALAKVKKGTMTFWLCPTIRDVVSA